MKRTIRVFSSQFELAEALALFIVNNITEGLKDKPNFTIALSGGSTPSILFSVLSDHFGGSTSWKNVHFFWADERCVPPDDNQSNFGVAKKSFFDRIQIPEENIHRIIGENDPVIEAQRYSDILTSFTEQGNGIPALNMTLLGLGEDGHIASIFPGSENIFKTGLLCVPVIHPLSGQKRITLSGGVINNSKIICFMVTGSKKKEIVKEIIEANPETISYPAHLVKPVDGDVFWYLDYQAAEMLEA